jgi:hypothetical protein
MSVIAAKGRMGTTEMDPVKQTAEMSPAEAIFLQARESGSAEARESSLRPGLRSNAAFKGNLLRKGAP